MYTVVCDCCGHSADEGGDYSAWAQKEGAEAVADDSGWLNEGDKHYCEMCFSYDDEDNLVIKQTDKL